MKTYTPVYFIKKVLIFLIILLPVSMFIMQLTVVRAEDKIISDFEKVPDDQWPSQVIFDTVHVCYGGTVRWIALGNPHLLNTPPPPYVSRLMTVHCFCVLDKIRTEYKYQAYVDYINKDDKTKPVLIPRLFMKKSIECINKHGTLQGLVILDKDALKGFEEFVEDNATKVDKKKVDTPDNNSGKSDSPEQPEELPIRESPLLNF